MERITSPDQLNKMMRVSKARVWIALIVLLLLVSYGIYWFFNDEVEVSEVHPCYISTDVTTVRQYVHDILYESSGSEDLAQYEISEAINRNGEESMNQEIHPAVIYLRDISETELVELMPIQVEGLNGSVISFPNETLDCSKIIKGADFTSEEQCKVGMEPGIDYYPVLVALATDQDIKVESGLYKAKVILNVIKPIDLIIN